MKAIVIFAIALMLVACFAGCVGSNVNESKKSITDSGLRAIMEADKYIAGPGDTIHFTGAKSFSEGGVIISWKWDFGDSTTGEGREVKHSYSSIGNYTTTLTVKDNKSRTSTISEKIKIVPASEVPKSSQPLILECNLDDFAGTELQKVELYQNGLVFTNFSWDGKPTSKNITRQWSDEMNYWVVVFNYSGEVTYTNGWTDPSKESFLFELWDARAEADPIPLQTFGAIWSFNDLLCERIKSNSLCTDYYLYLGARGHAKDFSATFYPVDEETYKNASSWWVEEYARNFINATKNFQASAMKYEVIAKTNEPFWVSVFWEGWGIKCGVEVEKTSPLLIDANYKITTTSDIKMKESIHYTGAAAYPVCNGTWSYTINGDGYSYTDAYDYLVVCDPLVTGSAVGIKNHFPIYEFYSNERTITNFVEDIYLVEGLALTDVISITVGYPIEVSKYIGYSTQTLVDDARNKSLEGTENGQGHTAILLRDLIGNRSIRIDPFSIHLT